MPIEKVKLADGYRMRMEPTRVHGDFVNYLANSVGDGSALDDLQDAYERTCDALTEKIPVTEEDASAVEPPTDEAVSDTHPPDDTPPTEHDITP